ncbi:hypothetical protein [Paenilisteria weihenstephanensis]|nr:hypothetical protein [Listeria weihenstephanensis]
MELDLHEYRALLKGLTMHDVDKYQLMAKQAMAIGYTVMNNKAKENKIFDAKKALKKLEQSRPTQSRVGLSKLRKAKAALENFEMKFTPE